jgi:hypothetical protein
MSNIINGHIGFVYIGTNIAMGRIYRTDIDIPI